jgi:hypothetical protein
MYVPQVTERILKTAICPRGRFASALARPSPPTMRRTSVNAPQRAGAAQWTVAMGTLVRKGAIR